MRSLTHATPAERTGLMNGTLYTFKLRAVNTPDGDGEGEPALPVTATPSATPSAPPNLDAEGGNQRVTLSWGEPSNTGGSPIERYEYCLGEAENSPHDACDEGRLSWTPTGQGAGGGGDTRRRRSAAQKRYVVRVQRAGGERGGPG